MWKNPFTSSGRPTTSAHDLSLSPAIRDRILKAVGSRAIPAVSASARRVFELTTNPAADARDFVEVLQSDEALAARVIKMANSVFFSRGAPCDTVDAAVTAIGLVEIRNLLSSSSLAELFPSPHPLRVILWEHDVSVAIASKVLAAALLPSKCEAAFLSGLMHDIGKLLLLQRVPKDFQQSVAELENTGGNSVLAENSLFPFDHTEVGLLIAERWSFPDEIKEAIRTHHDSGDALGPQPNINGIVKTADLLVHSLVLAQAPAFQALRSFAQSELPAAWELLAVAPADQQRLQQAVRTTVESERAMYVG